MQGDSNMITENLRIKSKNMESEERNMKRRMRM